MRAIRIVSGIAVELGGLTFRFRRPTASELLVILEQLLMPLRDQAGGAAAHLVEVSQASVAPVGLLWEPTPELGALDTSLPSRPWRREELLVYGAQVMDELSAAGLSLPDIQTLSASLTTAIMGDGAEVARVANFTDQSAV